jgi:hypothetical protein
LVRIININIVSVRIFWFLHLSFASSICLHRQTPWVSCPHSSIQCQASNGFSIFLPLKTSDMVEPQQAPKSWNTVLPCSTIRQFGQGTIKLSVSCRMFLGSQWIVHPGKVFFEPFWDPAAAATQRNHRGSAPLVPPCHVPRWCGLGKEYTNLSAYCTSHQKPSTAGHIEAFEARMIQTDPWRCEKLRHRVWGHTATLLSKMICASTLAFWTKQNFLQTTRTEIPGQGTLLMQVGRRRLQYLRYNKSRSTHSVFWWSLIWVGLKIGYAIPSIS